MTDVPYTPITIEAVDRAVRDWFDKTMDVRVKNESGELHKVPINFSQGERWNEGRARDSLRDVNGVMVLPIIAIFRSGFNTDPSMSALGVQTDYIQIAKRVDPKTNDVKDLELEKNQFGRDLQAVYDVYTIPFPTRVIAQYQVTFRSQFISQMNDMIEKLWNSLDVQRSFVAPLDNDGRQPPRSDQMRSAKPLDSPYVVGFFEELSDSGNFSDFTDQERIVQYDLSFTVPFVMQAQSEGRPPVVKVQRTAYKVVLGDERVNFVSNPADLDKIFGKTR